MNDGLMRAADAFFTAILVAIAALGVALGHAVALLLAMVVVLAGAMLARRLLRP